MLCVRLPVGGDDTLAIDQIDGTNVFLSCRLATGGNNDASDQARVFRSTFLTYGHL